MQGSWTRPVLLPARTFVCGYPACGQTITSETGWSFLKDDQYEIWFIYLCPACHRPTFFDHFEHQTPSPEPA